MDIYAVLEHHHYDSSNVIGVFDSLDKAKDFVLSERKKDYFHPLHPDKKSLVWLEFEDAWRHDPYDMFSYGIEKHTVQ